MQTEIEVKFLDINHAAFRQTLKDAGATCEIPMRLMRRVVMDYPDRHMQTERNGWIRIRDEGDKITLTYKQVQENKASGAVEIELTVDSYDKAIALFEAIGLKQHGNQETRRETWTCDDCEVVLDEWPWLKPYIEIEGPSETSIKNVAAKLGFDWNDAVFGSANAAYQRQYPGMGANETVSSIDVPARFDAPLPQWLKDRQS